MEHRSSHDCEMLLSYIVEECSEEERIMFEKHLLGCPSCRKEAQELNEVWGMLPFHIEETDVPNDLKSEVMAHIFEEGPIDSKQSRRRPSFSPLYSFLTAAILLVALVFALFENVHIRNQLAALEGQTAVTSEIVRVYSLIPVGTGTAKGTVQLVKQGNDIRIVANVEGLSATAGKEVYQVWLLHNGKRRNAGTFRVDSIGNGALVYKMKNPDLPVDGIGITLEPDADGTQPRGKKVLGS